MRSNGRGKRKRVKPPYDGAQSARPRIKESPKLPESTDVKEETTDETIRHFLEEEKELNAERTLSFPIDGCSISVRYRRTQERPRVKTDRRAWYESGSMTPKPEQDRAVVFSSTFPDASDTPAHIARHLRKVSDDLRSNEIANKYRFWIADALDRLASQYHLLYDFRNSPPDLSPTPDWDARAHFGLPVNKRGRPKAPGWHDAFLALDVEFGRAGGMSVEDAIAVTANAWYLNDKDRAGEEVVRKARKRLRKQAQELVECLVKQDQRFGIALADSVADHWEGLSRWIPLNPGFKALVTRRYPPKHT